MTEDNSNSSLVSTEIVDLKSFDNIINVDTTLAVDVDKIEKIKKEYSVDEEGISEK